MSEREFFCPRHGKASSPVEIRGLRCDCPEVLLDAISPYIEIYDGEGFTTKQQDSVGKALAQAVRLGYQLGLTGGVRPDQVHMCFACGVKFLSVETPKSLRRILCEGCLHPEYAEAPRE